MKFTAGRYDGSMKNERRVFHLVEILNLKIKDTVCLMQDSGQLEIAQLFSKVNYDFNFVDPYTRTQLPLPNEIHYQNLCIAITLPLFQY